MSQIFDWNCLNLKKIEQLSTVLHDFWSRGAGFRRRVDSLHLIDAFLFEQRITLDWNLYAVNKLLEYCDGEAAFIPVSFFQKRIFFDIDASSFAGDPIHITRRRDGHRIQALIILGLAASYGAVLSESLYLSALTLLIARESDARLFALIDRRLSNTKLITPKLAARLFEKELFGCFECEDSLHSLAKAVRACSRVMAFVRSLESTYIQCIEVTKATCSSGVKLKISNLDSRDSGGGLKEYDSWPMRWRSKTGAVPAEFYLPATSIGQGIKPAHLRVGAPEGIHIDDFELLDREGQLVSSSQKPGSPNGEVKQAFHHRQAVVLDRGLYGTHRVKSTLNVSRAIFAFPAFFLQTLTVALLTLGFLAGADSFRNTSSFPSALLLVPTIPAAFILRDTEHGLVSELLKYPRILFGLSTLGTGIIGGILMLSSSGSVWFGSKWIGAACALVLLSSIYVWWILFVHLWQIRNTRKRKNYFHADKRRLRALGWLIIWSIMIFTCLVICQYSWSG